MKPRAPFGFLVCGLISAGFGVAMAMAVFWLDLMPGNEGFAIPVRGGAALLAALSAVATDALWLARRWAYPATLALSLAYAAAVAVLCLSLGGVLAGAIVAFFLLLLSSAVLVPIVFYVRDQSRRRFGFPRHRPPPAPPAQPRVVPPPRVRPSGGPHPWW